MPRLVELRTPNLVHALVLGAAEGHGCPEPNVEIAETLDSNRKAGLPITFRTPPAPYRERAYTRGVGFCCVCGQPVYRFGWHVDLWNGGANKNANWHCACVIAWEFWNAPIGEAPLPAPASAAVRSDWQALMEEC